MFEAVVTLCLSLADDLCRDVLLPGYEAPSAAACSEKLADTAPDIARFDGLTAKGDATCLPAGAALEVNEVAPGLFVHAGVVQEPDAANGGDVANLGFVISSTGVAVIDTGSTRAVGEGLWRAIRARTDLPVTHVILTHMHPDHVLGVSVFADAGAEVVGHEALPRALADRRENYLESLERLVGAGSFIGTDTRAVTLPVTGTVPLDLGDRVLELTAWPPAHTGTDLTVLDRDSGVMFAGDLVFDRHTPALDGSLLGWQGVMARLTDLDLTGIVPGHGAARLDWPEGAAPMVRYLDTLARDTRAAISAGQRLGDAIQVIAQGERDAWELFDAYNPRNATVAFTELEWE
ncbi:quinoprotein relay system zinc metallohydrolase 2 [Litorisediminicola beolgyonensis]|uniref:Quinoprotein relay system zinc metallohydrolase 2 n=1 Tax=Litorisediminicola beolgyonensis TaxID=1173614 RepID=A0ABW3ZNN7_9RHOB